MFFEMGYRNLPAKINPASKSFNSASSKEIGESLEGPVHPSAVQFHEPLFAFGRLFTETASRRRCHKISSAIATETQEVVAQTVLLE
jgi:hypothetical protein